MTCDACATVRKNPYSGLYNAKCFGCAMRALARSHVAHDAKVQRSDQPLRDALAVSHPNVPIEVALSAIRDWWKLDHPKPEEGATA